MTLDVDVLVVGASVAGARCVQELRQAGYPGSILLAGDEPELPYDRPPLSKQFLTGEWDQDRLRVLTTERADELDVQLRLGCAASALDAARRTVTFDSEGPVRYGRLVVATGAAARPSPWGTPPGVYTVRTLADSQQLRLALRPGARIVVIGGGWIGAEITASAAKSGCRVLVVDVATNPYQRSVGSELGAILAGIHAHHGVDSRFGVGVAGIRTVSDRLMVELSDSAAVDADAVVVGIGATPNTGWLAGSALAIDDGVACDEFGRALGVADVWAIGDVARWGERRREHWTSAHEQARAVAHNIATPNDLVGSADDGYVWSDQHSWKIQLAGETGPHLDCELLGDPGQPRMAALYSDAAGLLVGVATVNWPKAFLAGRRAIGSGSAAVLAATLRPPVATVSV
jgi:NADPH-dependent 2,4-dienoyl-CoA reductase/sulfur reductase-like enzyme